MNRQQRRAQERAEQKLVRMGDVLRAKNPLADDVWRQGYNAGLRAGSEFVIKDCYAAAVLALHDLEGYGTKRNTRFLQVMDGYIVNSLSTEEIIDEALQRAGVSINFREPFPENRIQEAEG